MAAAGEGLDNAADEANNGKQWQAGRRRTQ
jgi:hypothetical protein